MPFIWPQKTGSVSGNICKQELEKGSHHGALFYVSSPELPPLNTLPVSPQHVTCISHFRTPLMHPVIPRLDRGIHGSSLA